MAIELKARIRNVVGKGAARAVRNNRGIPAVIYGNKQEPTAIELDAHAWGELIKKPGLRTKLFKIETPKGAENAMMIDIQYHPVKDIPIHVDFKRIDVKMPVHVNVPLQLMNAESARGVKLGGILNFAVRKVAIVAKIDAVPETIPVDVKDLGIAEVIHGTDLKLPADVELGQHQADLAFITITGKMKEETDAAKIGAATAEAPGKPTAGTASKAEAKPAEKPAAKK